MNLQKKQREIIRGKVYLTILKIVLSLLALIVAFPLYNCLVLSFTTQNEAINSAFVLFPKEFTLDSYRVLFANKNFIRGFLNTGVVVVFGTTYSMLLTIATAYALSKNNYPGRKLFGKLIVFTMYFGGGIIPYYLLVLNMGMVDSLLALIIPPGINTFYLLILKSYFENVPYGIIESVKLDSSNEFIILFLIVVPISMPIIVTFILFYAVDRWNDWFGALLFIKSNARFPLQYILRTVIASLEAVLDNSTVAANLSRTQSLFSDGVKMACVVVVTAPILILYPFAQKYFSKGIMIGAIKA